MKRNILYLTALATLSLSVMACNDEVVHQVQSVDAPSMVSVSPQENIKAGLDSIIVTYDNKVFFVAVRSYHTERKPRCQCQCHWFVQQTFGDG